MGGIQEEVQTDFYVEAPPADTGLPPDSSSAEQPRQSLKRPHKKGGPSKVKRSRVVLVDCSSQTEVALTSSEQQTDPPPTTTDFACQFPPEPTKAHLMDHTYFRTEPQVESLNVEKPLLSTDKDPGGYKVVEGEITGSLSMEELGLCIPVDPVDIDDHASADVGLIDVQEPGVQEEEETNDDSSGSSSGSSSSNSSGSSSSSSGSESSSTTVSSAGESRHSSDASYQPTDSSSSDEDDDPEVVKYCKESKFLVFESSLDQLLYSLQCTKCSSSNASVDKVLYGTMVSVTVTCSSGHTVLEWSSQPSIGKAPVGNLLCSAAVLFSGNTFTNISHFCNLMNLQFFSPRLFYDIQGRLLIPVVNSYYNMQTQDILQSFSGCNLTLTGDGRCDSPGYSAKYCSYTMMCAGTNKIVCSELVQVSQASSSVAMEKIGFKKCLDGILESNSVSTVATDQHTGIRKLMRESYADINHQFDVWHLAKSIGKKLSALAKQRDMTELGPWIPAIKNHFWWCAQNCNNNWELLTEMWTSVVHHVCNVHSWNSCDHYHRCSHDDLSPEEERQRKWLKPGSKAHEALKGVVFNKLLLKDLEHVTEACHTGSLEAFHNLLLKYCPKRLHFKFPAMQARLQLAILDNNHNCETTQAVVRSPAAGSLPKGALRYKRCYSKATKQWTLKPIVEGKNYSYLWDLMVDVLQFKQGHIVFEAAPLPELPSNVAAVPCPPLAEMVQMQKTRFTS